MPFINRTTGAEETALSIAALVSWDRRRVVMRDIDVCGMMCFEERMEEEGLVACWNAACRNVWSFWFLVSLEVWGDGMGWEVGW